MTSVVGYKRQPLSCQSKRQASSSAGKPPSKVHMTINNGYPLITCSYTNIPTEINMDRYKDVIILN